MGNSSMKHEKSIIAEIKQFLVDHDGIMGQDSMISIISKYYSEGYSKDGGYKIISRDVIKRGIAVEMKVRLPASVFSKHQKSPTDNPIITIYVSNAIPQEHRQDLVKEYIKNIVRNVAPLMKRSISREILRDNPPPIKQKPVDYDFLPMSVRAMMLHLFLVTTFKSMPFDVGDIAYAMPLSLVMQIIRNIDPKYLGLHPAILIPPETDKFLEVESILSMLKPPYNPLVIDGVLQRTTEIEIPIYDIHKTFDFIDDNLSVFQYWSIISAVLNETPYSYPITVCQRFEPYLETIYSQIPLQKIPFFPREVEETAWSSQISASILSPYFQKLFKKRLRSIDLPRRQYLEARLFPTGGLASLLASGASAFPCGSIARPEFFEDEFEIDTSPVSLVRLIIMGRLTRDGFLSRMTADYGALRSNARRWAFSSGARTRNLVAGITETRAFAELYNHTLASLLYELHSLEPLDDALSEEATSGEIVRFFDAGLRMVDLDHNAAVAVEILKCALAGPLSLAEIASRQLCHLRNEDVSRALWALFATNSVSLRKGRCFVRMPRCDWRFDGTTLFELAQSRNVSAFPQKNLHIFALSAEESPISLSWDGLESLSDTKQIIAGEFSERRMAESLSEMSLHRTMVPLPALPPITAPPSCAYSSVEDFVSTDPLAQFSFARFDPDTWQMNTFIDRLVFGVVSSSEVDGVSLLELADTFGYSLYSPHMSEILASLDRFVRLGLVCRVSTTGLEPHWSRHPECCLIAKPTMRRVELVQPHAWIGPDGRCIHETLDGLRKSIATFVFIHNGTNFHNIVDEFSMVSPYDLMSIINALVADEVLNAKYYREFESSLLTDSALIPTPAPSIEVFLGILSMQRKGLTDDNIVMKIGLTNAGLSNL